MWLWTQTNLQAFSYARAINYHYSGMWLIISLDLITRIFALLDLRSINVLGSNSGHPFNFQISKLNLPNRCVRVSLSYALSNSSFLSALQTSQVLHILMNAQLMYEPIVLWHFQPDRKFVFSRICLLTSWACTLGIWSTLVQLNLITQIY